MYICKRNSRRKMEGEWKIAQRVRACVSAATVLASPVWGPLFLSLYFFAVCMCTAGGDEGKKKKPASAELVLVHPLRAKPTRERETGRLMAAIRARIKMVGPRQLYRLGSDGAVGMRLYTHRREREREREKKKPSSRHSITGIAPPVLALPVYLRIRRQNGRRRTSS